LSRTARRARPDYPLPTGNVVPHMHHGGDAPIFANENSRYPVLLFSHGLTGNRISGETIGALRLFASRGYAVVAPFHGDPRYANVTLDGFRDAIYALIHFKDFVAMQAVRPLSLSAALGTADTTAPITATENGFDYLNGTRQLVGRFSAKPRRSSAT